MKIAHRSLLAVALLASVAFAAEAPPDVDRAAVWLFGDLVPSGVLTGQEAGLVAGALALCLGDSVPMGLAAELLSDATAFVERHTAPAVNALRLAEPRQLA